MTTQPILQLHDVTKDFDGLRAVDAVSLGVDQGMIVGLIGPNGSGKSTLLSLITGNHQPTAGQVIFNGDDITGLSPDEIFLRGIARGYQDPALFFQMTVLDNVLLPAKHQRGERPWYAPWRRSWLDQEQGNAARSEPILQQVSLRSLFSQPAADLSGGQMKLAEMGRALMGEPTLLLLDEPTAGVAPSLAYHIFEQIELLRRQQGMTFLIVEHRLEILFDFVDYLYVMHMGKLLAQGHESGKTVKQMDVGAGAQQIEMFALPMYVDQVRGHVAEDLQANATPIDATDIASTEAHFAVEGDPIRRIGVIQFLFGKEAIDFACHFAVGRQTKGRLDLGKLRPGAHPFRRAAVTQK